MSFEEFITKYNGKGIDFDGAYGFQCMDLAHRYAVDVIRQDIPSAPAAKDVWNKTTIGYDKIKNIPEGLPQKGDIVIWGTEIGSYGHIAVFIEGNLNTFTSFDQNFPIGSLCHKQPHSYKGVLGWLHAKTAVVDAVSVPKADFETLVRKSTAYDGICNFLGLDKNSTTSKLVIDQFEKNLGRISQLQKALSEVEAERETLRKERDQALSDVCPDSGVHTNNNNGNSNGSDNSSYILGNDRFGNIDNTPAIRQENFIEKLIAIFLKWFR